MPFWHRCCQESSLKRGLVQPLYALHSRDDVRGQSAALRDCGAGKPRWSKTRLVRKTSIKIDILHSHACAIDRVLNLSADVIESVNAGPRVQKASTSTV